MNATPAIELNDQDTVRQFTLVHVEKCHITIS